MIPNRPIIYLAIPSIAAVLGLVWYRRKQSVHCDTGGGEGKKVKNKKQTPINESSVTDKVPYQQSDSRPITKNSNSVSSENSKEAAGSDKFGKSAPIDIVPNQRSPPAPYDPKLLDAELLKLKIQESDLKNLRSIEEQDDFESVSPVLPGSAEIRKFNFVNTAQQKIDPPIVIKANMSAAKISPKGSFAPEEPAKFANAKPEEKDEGRESANQSPVEDKKPDESKPDGAHNNLTARQPPIASPPLSLCSVQSNDSGKGSSPPHSVGAPATTYDFIISSNLVGHLIGRKGSYVNRIKDKTGANVVVRRHPESSDFKVCSIEGTQQDINGALKMIRERLPEKLYPNLTLQRVYFANQYSIVPLPAVETNCLHLQLIEGINNDVTISYIVSGGQIFLQQPLHPSFPSLNRLQTCLNQTYSMIKAPQMPKIVEDSVCIAPVQDSWYRVQIVSHNPKTKTCLVKYLDFGGFMSVLSDELRQIRGDFLSVPFQATECILSNIKPKDNEWTPEAAEVLNSLTNGLIIQAQVAGYTQDGLPEVYLYACLAKDNIVFINKELVARGLADWTEMETEAA